MDESPPVPVKASIMLDIRSNTSENIGNCKTAIPIMVRPNKEPITFTIELTALALRKLLKIKSNTVPTPTKTKALRLPVAAKIPSVGNAIICHQRGRSYSI